MPYRWSLYYVAFFFPVTILGFWKSYFSPIGTVPLAFHIHAFTALAWLSLLMLQIWSIQNRHNELHKAAGKASFALFPLLILGLVMIVNLTASRYLAGDGSRAIDGPSVGSITFVAISAYLTLFYLAMRYRQDIKLHAGFLLAMPLILFESPAGRASFYYLDWPPTAGRTVIQQLADNIAAFDMIAMAFALLVFFFNRKKGAPWLVASAFLGLQAIVVYTTEDIPGFNSFFVIYGRIPEAITLGAALLVAGFVTWLGWTHGRRTDESHGIAQPAE